MWPGELALQWIASDSLSTSLPRAGNALNGFVLRIVTHNNVVFSIRDDHPILSIYAEMLRAVQFRFGCRAMVFAHPLFAECVYDSPDIALRIYDPQCITATFEDVDISQAIRCNRSWVNQWSVRRNGTIDWCPLLAIPRYDGPLARLKVDCMNSLQVCDEQFFPRKV